MRPPDLSNELLATLLAAVESAGEAVIIADLEGSITYVNPAFEQITQYSRHEVLGKNPRLLKCDRNDPAIFQDLWQTITRGKVWKGSFLNRKKDGSIYRVAQTISPVADDGGRVISYVSVHRDVTDLASTQAVLRLAAAVESAGDAIVLADLDGTILYVNRAYERINDTSRAKVVGQNLWTLEGGAENLATPKAEELWSTLARGSTWRGSFQGRRPSGAVHVVEKTVAPVRNVAGMVIGYISIGRDLTHRYARREAERQLAAVNSEMEFAQSIQQRLYPRNSLTPEGYDLAGRTFPADHLCGDYFDYVLLCDGSLGMVVGDATGHGLGAALLMIDVRAYLRGLATCIADMSEILRRVNSLLAGDVESAGFITLLFARLDASRHTLAYAGAGHEGYLLKASGQVVRLESTGLPLGI
jgi:PAS domain S-box-containing protein